MNVYQVKRKEEREWEEMNQNIPSGVFAEEAKKWRGFVSREVGGKERYFKKEEITGCPEYR